MKSKVLLIQSEGLGTGDNTLGGLLMANFLRLLGESKEKPKRIMLWNVGVRLACQGSGVVDYLKRLDKQGVQILSCSTCLEHLELADKLMVGKPTNMLKSIESILNDDVVTL